MEKASTINYQCGPRHSELSVHATRRKLRQGPEASGISPWSAAAAYLLHFLHSEFTHSGRMRFNSNIWSCRFASGAHALRLANAPRAKLHASVNFRMPDWHIRLRINELWHWIDRCGHLVFDLWGNAQQLPLELILVSRWVYFISILESG